MLIQAEQSVPVVDAGQAALAHGMGVQQRQKAMLGQVGHSLRAEQWILRAVLPLYYLRSSSQAQLHRHSYTCQAVSCSSQVSIGSI